jgi:hypothetical protein
MSASAATKGCEDDHEYKAAVAARLSSDFKIKSCPAFVGCTGIEGKGPKVLCFNMQPIPLTPAAFGDKKQLAVNMVVVDCKLAGYSKVPIISMAGDKYKLGKDPLPLSEKSPWECDPSGRLSELTCYPFEIVPGRPKNKNKRNEDCMWKVSFICFLV